MNDTNATQKQRTFYYLFLAFCVTAGSVTGGEWVDYGARRMRYTSLCVPLSLSLSSLSLSLSHVPSPAPLVVTAMFLRPSPAPPHDTRQY